MVARFLSPDPFISAPGNWDSYNRYGYCFNNPLLFTDPSGNKPFFKWLKENTWDKFWGSLNGTDPDGDGVYTGGLNEKFIKWGIPSFGVNVNYNFTASNPQFKPDGGSRGNFVSGALTYKNVEVFNTESLHQPDYAGINAGIDKAFSSEIHKNILSMLLAKKLHDSPYFMMSTTYMPNPLFGASAASFDGGLNFIGIEGDVGVVLILAGRHQGEYALFDERASGVGLAGSAGFEIARYDYTIGNEYVTWNNIFGKRFKIYGGIGEGLGAGVGIAVSPDENGNFFIGTSISYGYTVTPFGIDLGFNNGSVMPF